MCVISNLTAVPCAANPPGIKTTMYIVPVAEITAEPGWSTGTAEGDYVKTSGNYDFTVAGAGKGYWRSFPILIDTGSYQLEAVGDKGSKQWKETFTFTIQGVNAEQLEFCTRMLNIPSAFLIPDKNSVIHTVGHKDEAAYVDTATGGTGEGPEGSRTIQVTVVAYTARPMVYGGTIDTTPNT
jgi:hypothetical protein